LVHVAVLEMAVLAGKAERTSCLGAFARGRAWRRHEECDQLEAGGLAEVGPRLRSLVEEMLDLLEASLAELSVAADSV
jgi:hypothetical protein